MAILQEYRKKTRAQGKRGYRRGLILAVLLCLVAVMMVLLNRYAGKRSHKPATASQPTRVTAKVSPVPSQPRRGAAAWRPLTARKERELLARIVDQTPLGVREHRDAYFYLLNKIHNMSDVAIAARVDRSITYADYADQPDIVRGSFVEVAGHLLRLEKTPLDPAQAMLPAVYEGQILDAENRVYSFCLTEPPQRPFLPGTMRIRDALRVRLQGVFMQVITYRNREDPPRDVVTPLIIGRRLVESKAGPRPSTPPWIWIAAFGGLSTLIGTGIILGLRRTRRS